MLTISLPSNSVREVIGGFLEQTRDQNRQEWSQSWKIIGEEPSETVKRDLLFAWILCAHLKSNAIAVVKNLQSLGLGMGEVSRVAAVRSALRRVREFHSSETKNLILASDGFFSFS